jgi:DNA-binding transcriptional ArsR family regulator
MANHSDLHPPDQSICGEACLALLADPTRRAIVQALRSGPRAVGDVAADLPISRPAVSQHLRCLSNAGLVRAVPKGTRRLYHLDPAALAALHSYLDGLWGDVLGRFAEFVDAQNDAPMLPPIVKTLYVPVAPDEAFHLFTARMGDWWPLDSHSLSARDGGLPKSVEVEPRIGGQIIEHCADGEHRPWGRVTAWQPGEKFAVAWHEGRCEAEATDVTIAFAQVDGGTCVTLNHEGWEVLGYGAAPVRGGYQTGWDLVLVERVGGICLASCKLAAE